jgi:hypothetical protein
MVRRLVRRLLVLSAFAFGAAVGCGLVGERVDGSGMAVTEDRPLGPVNEVVLAGIGDLTVVPGPETRLRVTADDNVLPLLESTSAGGTLTLGVKGGYNPKPKTPIRYELTVKAVDRLTVSGAGNAALNAAAGPEFEAKVSGAGNIKLTALACKAVTLTVSGAGNVTAHGTADRLTGKVSGAGDIKAGDLKVGSADATISGAGNMTVWATESLKAHVSGAGSVKYRGQPAVEKSVSGAGRVKPVSE